jgi:hypothetical protein
VTVAKLGITPPPIIKPPIKQEPTSLSWEGQVPAQKWMNFYTKVLSKFALLYPSAGDCLDAAIQISADTGTDCVVQAHPAEAYYQRYPRAIIFLIVPVRAR